MSAVQCTRHSVPEWDSTRGILHHRSHEVVAHEVGTTSFAGWWRRYNTRTEHIDVRDVRPLKRTSKRRQVATTRLTLIQLTRNGGPKAVISEVKAHAATMYLYDFMSENTKLEI